MPGPGSSNSKPAPSAMHSKACTTATCGWKTRCTIAGGSCKPGSEELGQRFGHDAVAPGIGMAVGRRDPELRPVQAPEGREQVEAGDGMGAAESRDCCVVLLDGVAGLGELGHCGNDHDDELDPPLVAELFHVEQRRLNPAPVEA